MYQIKKDEHFLSLEVALVKDPVLLALEDVYIDHGTGPIVISKED